jgi:hypothetical protein
VCPRSTRTHHFSKAVALLVAGRVLVYAKTPMRLPTLDQYRNVGLWACGKVFQNRVGLARWHDGRFSVQSSGSVYGITA